MNANYHNNLNHIPFIAGIFFDENYKYINNIDFLLILSNNKYYIYTHERFDINNNYEYFIYFSYDFALQYIYNKININIPLIDGYPDMIIAGYDCPEQNHIYNMSSIDTNICNFSKSKNCQLISDNEYIEQIKMAQEYMKRGDNYLINITRPFQIKSNTNINNENIIYYYENLNNKHKTNMNSFFQFQDWHIISMSMERFVKIENNIISTYPIKGSLNICEPIDKLINNKKEQSEHLMIVDLMRNDLGQICKPSSINVKKYAYIEEYKYIWQMVSQITGHIKNNESILKIILSLLPVGSISGTPKYNSMNIISKIEKYKRHAYTGIVGYIDINNKADFSVLIRSIYGNNEKSLYHTGCGITLDSDPILECRESHLKFLI